MTSSIKIGDEYEKKKTFDRRQSGRHGTVKKRVGEC